MKMIATALLLTAATMAGASAEVLTLNDFSIDAEGGTWNEVTLSGVDIDTSGYLQGFYIDGTLLDAALVSSTATSAIHTGTLDALSFTVTSNILSATPTRATFRTTFVLTNGGAPLSGVELVSNVDGDLNDTTSDGDTVRFADGRVLQFDGIVGLYGVATGEGEAGRELSLCCSIPSFPLPNNNGPIGPDDVQFNLGFLFDLAADQSRTFVFDYEFATDLDVVDTPAPAGLALFGLAAAALGFARRRR